MDTALDPELLEAFLPEWREAVLRLAEAGDAAAATRALDALRGLAGAFGIASLKQLLASLQAEPFEAAPLRAAAEALLAQAEAIAAAGHDLPLPEAAAPPPAPPLPPPPEPLGPPLDAELFAAFLPEWRQACAALASATPETAGPRLEALRGLAGALGLASLRAALAEAPAIPEPADLALLQGLAATLSAQAEAIAAAGHDLPAAPPGPLPPEPDRPRHRVLVVDDSALMRRLVRETLEADPDFQVVGEAADGRAALARMAELAPALTMLDIEMPVLDGIGTLREWALSGQGAVVIVSSAARPGSELAVLARRLGAASVVGKPSGAFSPDLRDRQGHAILRAARRALDLPVEA